MTYWAAGMIISADRLEQYEQTGEELVSFTSKTSFSVPVVFPIPFASPPKVSSNIAAAPGTSARWTSRVIGITAEGCTIFLESGASSAAAVDWSDVPVQWVATAS